MGPIVVVEDEPDVLEMVCDVLRTDGFPVVGFKLPQLVERERWQLPPSMFLLDLMLPGMSGIELANRLRANGFSDKPIVAMSASPQMLHAAASSGLFQEMIAKPFDLMTLIDCVERFAARPPAEYIP